MTAHLGEFLREETAATSVEYCFLAVLIIVACVVAISAFGSSLADLFTSSNDAMTQAFGS